MGDRTLPLWFRLILAGTALSQIFFGLTLLFNPAAIAAVWPWTMTPIAARLLGASSLVAVPLSLGSAIANRWSAARIPTVMNLLYRVLQLVTGLTGLSRFDFSRWPTWNYFGGGLAMLLVFGFMLARGRALGQPARGAPNWLRGESALVLSPAAKAVFRAVALGYVALAATLLALGPQGSALWIEAPGQLTPLTARLFGSPLTGLAAGLWLVTRARRWKEVGIPATAMVTIGLGALTALALERSSLAPPSPLGYLTAATPLILLGLGLYLLSPARSKPAAEA